MPHLSHFILVFYVASDYNSYPNNCYNRNSYTAARMSRKIKKEVVEEYSSALEDEDRNKRLKT